MAVVVSRGICFPLRRSITPRRESGKCPRLDAGSPKHGGGGGGRSSAAAASRESRGRRRDRKALSAPISSKDEIHPRFPPSDRRWFPRIREEASNFSFRYSRQHSIPLPRGLEAMDSSASSIFHRVGGDRSQRCLTPHPGHGRPGYDRIAAGSGSERRDPGGGDARSASEFRRRADTRRVKEFAMVGAGWPGIKK